MSGTAPTVAYHNPYPDSVYANRYIAAGMQNGFRALGCDVVEFRPGRRLEEFLTAHRPRVFITCSHFLYRKQLDFELLTSWRRQHGLVLLTKIDFWSSPFPQRRINEAPSMKDDAEAKRLVKAGLLGDHYFHAVVQGDPRMEGFAAFAGQGYETVPLAADPEAMRPEPDPRYVADVSFIGANLPTKRGVIDEWLLPLGQRYDLKVYGPDWTRRERVVGFVAKVGQYFNVPVVRSLQKPELPREDEARVFASSKVLVNLHEDHQRKFGGDCNERTFKIPFCSGLEICDDVACVRDYFVDGEEIVIATSHDDWFDKIDYYLEHPDEAKDIGNAGRRRVLAAHLYEHRARQLLDLAALLPLISNA